MLNCLLIVAGVSGLVGITGIAVYGFWADMAADSERLYEIIERQRVENERLRARLAEKGGSDE